MRADTNLGNILLNILLSEQIPTTRSDPLDWYVLLWENIGVLSINLEEKQGFFFPQSR